jgi:hypothetical protein
MKIRIDRNIEPLQTGMLTNRHHAPARRQSEPCKPTAIATRAQETRTGAGSRGHLLARLAWVPPRKLDISSSESLELRRLVVGWFAPAVAPLRETITRQARGRGQFIPRVSLLRESDLVDYFHPNTEDFLWGITDGAQVAVTGDKFLDSVCDSPASPEPLTAECETTEQSMNALFLQSATWDLSDEMQVKEQARAQTIEAPLDVSGVPDLDRIKFLTDAREIDGHLSRAPFVQFHGTDTTNREQLDVDRLLPCRRAVAMSDEADSLASNALARERTHLLSEARTFFQADNACFGVAVAVC